MQSFGEELSLKKQNNDDAYKNRRVGNVKYGTKKQKILTSYEGNP